MSQRTWLITGVSSGIGRDIARLALERGDRVAGTFRRADAVADLKSQYGERFWSERLDVTNTPAIRRTVDRAFAELGRIDAIVNNAGYGVLGAAEELTDEQIAHQIDTNLLGSIHVARAAIPHLRTQGGGRIIQVSTMGGQVTFPGASLYHASKWAIEGFMDALRFELAPFNISVTIVEPGTTGTSFGKNLVIAKPIDAYESGPVGQARAFFASGTYRAPGDSKKTARAIIATLEQDPAPLRLATGTDAYQAMRRGLVERLEALEAQRDLAASTDV